MNLLSAKKLKLILVIYIIALFSDGILLLDTHAGTAAQPQTSYGTVAQPQTTYGTVVKPQMTYGTVAVPKTPSGSAVTSELSPYSAMPQAVQGFDASKLSPQDIEYLKKAIKENRIDPELIRKAKEQVKDKTDELTEKTKKEQDIQEKREQDIQNIIEKKDEEKKLTDVVFLYGDVIKPGSYAFTNGMTIRDLLPGLSSLKQDAYLDYAIIKRVRTEAKDLDVRFDDKFPYRKKKKTDILITDTLKKDYPEIIAFNPGALLISGDETQNIELMPGDEVYVYNKRIKENITGYESEEDFFKKFKPDKDQPLKIFGHELFSMLPDTFEPISNAPVSRDYIVGPGDEIEALMWGRIDARYSLIVDREGKINFPQIGPIQVAGLTFEEMSAVLIGKAESITGVNISISMGKLRTIQVFVLGEVKSPGIYSVSSIATVSNALLYSGGPTELGSLRGIQIKRGGKIIGTIDLYNFMLKGDTTQDVRLMPQDVIFVPQAKTMVTVSGDVKRPAIYEFLNKPTLLTAINLAGGLTPKALNQRVQIQRYQENSSKVILDIPYEKLNKNNDISLNDGDIVKVFSLFDESKNSVFLYGNVRYPGQYGHKPGMRILDLLADVEALDVDTYFDYALIKRYPLTTMKSELIPFDLGKLINQNDKSQNIILEPRDEIYIFNKGVFEERKSADIEGPVRKPGRYFIDSNGTRIKDLVLKAGNLTRDAHMGVIHLYRVNKNSSEISLVALDLEKAIAGDLAHNLILEDQDRLIVHNKWDFKEKYTVSIKGMVNNPGEYPYAENMTVNDLICIAGNVKTAAYMDEGELVRTEIINGRYVETSVEPFNLYLALKKDSLHNKKLKPMDVVIVKSIPDWWDKKNEVEITGEVYFPGRYNIRKGEKLSELIERAGGFNEYAFLRGAVFTRESIKKLQQERIDEMLNRLEQDMARFTSQEVQSSLSKDELSIQSQFFASQQALISKLRLAKASGRIVVQMTPVNFLKNSPYDLTLEDGDTIYIPKETSTVTVLGSVYNQNAFAYDKNRKELKYYIAQTGGLTRNAEEESIYVIRADGVVLSKEQEYSFFGALWNSDKKLWGFRGKFENLEIYPGDTIIVPEKVIKPSYMRDIKDITAIIYQLAVTAGITITQIF